MLEGLLVKMNKLQKTLGIGALVLAANFTVNLNYNYYIENDRNRLRNSENEVYSKLKEATGKLSFLASLDCTTNRCLQEKSKLENEIEWYNVEGKQIQKLVSDLLINNHKKFKKAIDRGLVYGYFTK